MAPNADMNGINVRRKVMRMSLHCADVSNPAKTFSVYEKWAKLVMAEFYDQGDQERERGLPISPFYDRNNKQVSKCQVGFIQFIVRPLYQAFTELCHSLQNEIFNNLNKNQKEWERRMAEGIVDDEDDVPKVPKVVEEKWNSEIAAQEERQRKEAAEMKRITNMDHVRLHIAATTISEILEEEEEEEEKAKFTH